MIKSPRLPRKHYRKKPRISYCLDCGEPMEQIQGKGRTRKYCNGKCRLRAFSKRRNPDKPVEII